MMMTSNLPSPLLQRAVEDERIYYKAGWNPISLRRQIF